MPKKEKEKRKKKFFPYNLGDSYLSFIPSPTNPKVTLLQQIPKSRKVLMRKKAKLSPLCSLC